MTCPDRTTRRLAMPRRPGAYAATVFVLALALCRFAPGAAPVPVVDGVADARSIDFKSTAKITLKGEYLFEAGAWKQDPDPLAGRVAVPHRWSADHLPVFGKATYRLKLLLPPARGEPWALSLNDANVFHAPLRIRANGRLIHDNQPTGGGTGSNAEAPRGEWVALPDEPEVTLDFFLENPKDARGGRLDAPVLGPQSQILAHSQNRISNKLFSLGMMALGAVIFLFFFLLMPSSISSLYFALFCLSMMARTLSTQERIFDHAQPFLNYIFWNRLEQLGFFLTVLFFLLYLFSLFPSEGWRFLNRTLTAVATLFAVSAAFLPISWVTRLVDPFQIMTLVTGTYSIVILVRAVLHQQEGAWLLLGGFLVIFLTVINDILFAKSILHTGLFSPYAVSFFVMVMSVLLVYRHVRRIHLVRKSSAEAMEAREHLLANRAELIQLEAAKLYRDDATGLPNLARFEADLAESPEAGYGAVEFTHWAEHLRFFGAAAAHLLLKAAARNLVSYGETNHVAVYRLSASRFGLRYPGAIDETDGARIAAEISHWVSHPVPLGEANVTLQAFIALTCGHEKLLDRFNRTLQDAETRGSGYAWCPGGATEEDFHRRNLAVTREVAEALAGDRLVLFFQPILNNRTLEFDKHEALVRLRKTDGTILPPAAFLPAAKAGNLYGALTRQVLRLARERLETVPGSLSINISNRDLHDPLTCEALTETVRHPSAHRLIFEILESDGMGNYDRAIQFIQEAKAHGCRVAIDDFGSGYSNFEHLLRMKVDIIKIDGSLVKNLDSDPQARVLVDHIVDFSGKLGLETVAEFVHSGAIFDKVRAMGIHYSQGYHLGPPTEQGLFGSAYRPPGTDPHR